MKDLREEEKGAPFSPRPHPLTHPPWGVHAIRNARPHVHRVWEPMSRTGKEPFKALFVLCLPDTRTKPIRRLGMSILSAATEHTPQVPLHNLKFLS